MYHSVAICAEESNVFEFRGCTLRQCGHRLGMMTFDEAVPQGSVDRGEVKAANDAGDAAVRLQGSTLGQFTKPSTALVCTMNSVLYPALREALCLVGVIVRARFGFLRIDRNPRKGCRDF